MRRRIRNSGKILLTLVLLTLLAGCVQSGGEMTVHRDGSIDMKLSVVMDDRTRSLLGSRGEAAIDELLAEGGPPFVKNEEDGRLGYNLSRSYDSFTDFRNAVREQMNSAVFADAGDWVDVSVQKKNRWFYSVYSVRIAVKPEAYMDRAEAKLDSLGRTGAMAKLLLRRFVFDFRLNLPFDLAGANNADEDRGRSLVWHIRPVDPQPVEMEIRVPNPARIAGAAGAVLLLGAGGVVWLWRKRRKSRKNK
ncbi:hypothetical protein F4V43_17425 [Paenibacillus spiritus]|uniref:DUF3153 domain-containing protein n=1 Tax=Paenibacillus spiritus TaxID=2496557 RepID=A0A5J5FV88_9BACL|nr:MULTISPECIES: hypothetical protein [Paenibacillus]KAA8997543.1 hypothetical protein F4V43_17425 [Paenibacillus spiritus]